MFEFTYDCWMTILENILGAIGYKNERCGLYLTDECLIVAIPVKTWSNMIHDFWKIFFRSVLL